MSSSVYRQGGTRHKRRVTWRQESDYTSHFLHMSRTTQGVCQFSTFQELNANIVIGVGISNYKQTSRIK